MVLKCKSSTFVIVSIIMSYILSFLPWSTYYPDCLDFRRVSLGIWIDVYSYYTRERDETFSIDTDKWAGRQLKNKRQRHAWAHCCSNCTNQPSICLLRELLLNSNFWSAGSLAEWHCQCWPILIIGSTLEQLLSLGCSFFFLQSFLYFVALLKT